MNPLAPLRDDDAVSPVIGIILMVALTVVLSAVIGSFVLNLGGRIGSDTPQAGFGFDFTDNTGGTADELDIRYEGGDTISAERLTVTSDVAVMADADGAIGPVQTNRWAAYPGADAEVTSGDSITVESSESGADTELNGATIRVTWTSQSGESSAVLGTWTGPAA